MIEACNPITEVFQSLCGCGLIDRSHLPRRLQIYSLLSEANSGQRNGAMISIDSQTVFF